ADEQFAVVGGEDVRGVAEPFGDDALVVEQVAVGHHDAARGGGGSGGVLQEGDGVGAEAGLAPVGRQCVGDVLGGDPGDAGRSGEVLGQGVQHGDHLAVAE